MLLDLPNLIRKYQMEIKGILHVGAHLAEEAASYDTLGIKNVWWVEGNEDNISRIVGEVAKYAPPYETSAKVIWALVTDQDGEEVTFNITNYDSMSSSVLEFGTHPTFSPDTVFIEHRKMKTCTLDRLVQANGISNVNFLNMDLQGAELLALRGATKLLPELDYIYTEVNCDEVYKGCAQVSELDEFLTDFTRVETGWVGNQGWGDSLYVRKSVLR